MIPEYDCRFDPNAVTVARQNGEQIGHLSASRAGSVRAGLQQGYQYLGFITAMLEPEPEYQVRGVVLTVLKTAPGIGQEQIEEYLDQL